MPATRYPLLATATRRYFYSGWAFLIPYLAAYLLYYLTGWPVNPPTEASSTAHSPSPFAPPPLIHLYWSLHALHIILAAIALRSWWTQTSTQCDWNASDSQSAPYSSYRLHLLTRIAPWALLALIFYIPGVYLEWPSDPWEHLRRINEWHIPETVGAHSSWHKSAYFIPYSLLSWCRGLRQLFWLDFYYTGICLLLCWQYYRLSRACGLGERASMVFVILQALLFGNNIFSFYRYYGISTSIYAQLGAIALTRIALEWAARGTKATSALQETTTTGNDAATPLAPTPPTAPRPPRLSPVNSFFYSLLTTRYSLRHHSSRPTFWYLPSLLWLLASGLCLLTLTAFNHPQGIGIAGLGIAVIIIWRLIEWKRSMAKYLALAAILSSFAMVMWIHRHPTIDGIYRAEGWLSPWYGFNLFAFGSPAFDRAAQILGVFGAINIALGIWLITRRNHVAGWLTLLPVMVLALPCFALPFAQVIASRTYADNIITFHRFLFAVPMGLAVVTLFAGKPAMRGETGALKTTEQSNKFLHPLLSYRHLLIYMGLVGVITLSSGTYSYNRFWHGMQSVPADLQLRHQITPWTSATIEQARDENTLMIDTALGANVYQCFASAPYPYVFRRIGEPLDSHELRRQIAWHNLLEASEHANLKKTMKPTRQIQPRPQLEFDPAESSWTTLAGSPHQQFFLNGALVVGNSPGKSTDVFSSQMIPVSLVGRYQLTCSVRQMRGAPTVNYLAVIWYDREKKILESFLSQPEGAGAPAGWTNGTYSYYGLREQPAPAEWTSYTISFGPRMHAEVPFNAAFIRIGALLNYGGTPDAQVQLTGVQLQSKLIEHQLVWLPTGRPLYTPASYAGLLSGHWPIQQAAADHAGINELRNLLFPQNGYDLPPLPQASLAD
jgi:hypothetical protein